MWMGNNLGCEYQWEAIRRFFEVDSRLAQGWVRRPRPKQVFEWGFVGSQGCLCRGVGMTGMAMTLRVDEKCMWTQSPLLHSSIRGREETTVAHRGGKGIGGVG